MPDQTKHTNLIHASTYGPEMYGPNQRIALLCEGSLHPRTAKTAYGILRHAPNPVVALIDHTNAGRTAREATGIDHDAPIVATIEEAADLGAEVLVIGIAPKGGLLPESWREMISTALTRGIDVAAGLHSYLGDDPHFAELSEQNDAYIFDVRRPPRGVTVSTGACRHLEGKRIVVVVGTDASSGKMHVALALDHELRRRGVRSKFVPTGQTGVFIAGWGIAIDNVISDYTAGAAEMMVLHAAEEADVILVEGQGSLLHPGFSGVTLGLMHGSMPTDLLFCHPAVPVAIEREYGITLPSIPEMIKLHEHILQFIRPAKVCGVAVNSLGLDEAEAQALIKKIHGETNLPVTDVVRYDVAPLADLFTP
jgi:uncharacterized NAD-dependent epimerase/dehydratase family protein